MEALILSCSTGGGHNTAAQAVFEALTERGHHAVRMDPYTLVSEELANKVGQTYKVGTEKPEAVWRGL